jgi:hypothetical protein
MPSDNQASKKISGSETLTDILISVEDFFDSLDLYVFKNWLDGEVVDGPVVKRYWVSIILQYDYKDMPDPSGAERLMSRGCKVKFWKAQKEEARDPQGPDDFRKDGRGAKPVLDNEDIWLVEVQVPRRFVGQADATDANAAETAGIDSELLASAQDEDIDDKTAFEAPASEEPAEEPEAEGEDEEQA